MPQAIEAPLQWAAELAAQGTGPSVHKSMLRRDKDRASAEKGMMTMRNFARINNYWNRKAAWEDWAYWAAQARELGLIEELNELLPTDNAGWRTIDKRMAKLRAVVHEAQEEAA